MFPNFWIFLVVGTVIAVPPTVIIGWGHYKGFLRNAFKAEQDIGTESNPYTTRIIAPVNLPWLRLLVDIGRQLKLDTHEVESLITITEQRFELKKH